MPVNHGDDRRRLVPLAIVRVITHLIDADVEREGLGPSTLRAELRTIRTRLCRLYGLEDPQGVSRETDVMQHLEDDDGIPLEDTI